MADGVALNDRGLRIVKKGGEEGQDYFDMLLLELAKLMPGATPDELKTAFIAVGLEYGENALEAVRSGAVVIERKSDG